MFICVSCGHGKENTGYFVISAMRKALTAEDAEREHGLAFFDDHGVFPESITVSPMLQWVFDAIKNGEVIPG